MAYKNKEDQLRAQRKWYSKNKKKVMKRHAENKEKIKKWFREYKSTIKCSLCDENTTVCIDFHHVIGKKKKAVSLMVNEGYSKENIIKEIKKCIPLCANCHRKEHFKIAL